MTTDTEKIKELSLTNSLTDAYLLLQEIKELKRSLSLELDLARDYRKAQEIEFKEFMAELRATLTEIQANFRIEAQLLNLIRPNQTGDKKWQGKTDSNSNQRSLLRQFANKSL